MLKRIPDLKLSLLMFGLAGFTAGAQPSFTFDDGQVPSGSVLRGNNSGMAATNSGGAGNSGMLVMAVPGGANVQSYAQWVLPDLANGNAITNLALSFNVFLGGGSGGAATVRFPPAGGNGMVFHWGPGLLNQYSGSASSFGQGLDVTLRTYPSGVNPSGINIYYGGTGGAGNNPPIATNSFLDYYFGGATNFSSNTWVSLTVTAAVSNGQTNATLNLVCSNAWNGVTNIVGNLAIPNFTAPLANHTMAFTTTDGGGAHEYCYLDNVDFTVNGVHIANSIGSGPVVIAQQPASQTVPENVYATFTVGVNGTGPFAYQWLSNGVPLAGATAAGYTTPLTSLAMDGTVYAVVVSNYFSGATSSNATLTVIRQTTPADLPIYTDHLVNAFQDWGYGIRNLADTSQAHYGSASVSLSDTAGHNLSFWHSSFNISPYGNLSFWANGGSAGGQVLKVQALLNEVGQPSYTLSALPANTWQQFVIPLSALNAANATNFDRLIFQLSSGSGTFYLDDITITANPAPAVAHVSVNANQSVRTVDARMFGLNTASWDGNLDTPQTVALLNEMGCRALRFPGGSTADGYHWTVASVNHFAHVVTNIGAQAISTVNYGSGTAAEAAGWVGFCNVTNRYGFKYWEIGNECYGTWETDNNTNAPYKAHDPWTYAVRAADYLQQMKAADPTIKVGIVVTTGETSSSNGNTTHPATNLISGKIVYGWTPVVLATLKSLGVTPDFAAHHRYPEFSTSGSAACAVSDPLVLQSGSAWAADAADLRQQISGYFGAGGTNIELLVTENNSDAGSQSKQSVSLVNALYYANSLGRLLQTEFNGFVWWDLRNSTDNGGSKDPTLYGWRMYGDLGMINGLTNRYPDFYAAKLMQCLARPGDTILGAASDYALLQAYAARRASGAVTLLVCNGDVGSTFNAQIALNGFAPSAAATLYSYGLPQDAAAQFGTGSPDIATNGFSPAGTNFSYSFPPLSLTLFSFAPASPNLAALPPSGNRFVLQLQGQPGVYVLQSRTNLTAGAWIPVSTNMLADGPVNWTNTVTTGTAQQFWRVVWQP